MSRTTGCLLAASTLLAILATARPAPAQEPDEPDDVIAAPVEVKVKDVLAVEDPSANIDQWIFGGQGSAEARKKIEAALTRDLNRFDDKYQLTAAQKKKLELAGRRDVKRFFDRVDDAKTEYRRVKGDWNQVGTRIFELQRMQNQPHSELFGDESMLAKTLKKTLTPEQVAWNDKNVYRARVQWMAGLLDKRLNLNADQHRRLVTLVVEETPPLKRYGSFDYDAIMFQMSRLPREKLRQALDDAQCRELALRFDQARRMESILISEGYISQGRPAAKSAGSAVRGSEKAVLTRTDRVGSN
jgi:hypothetical protein